MKLLRNVIIFLNILCLTVTFVYADSNNEQPLLGEDKPIGILSYIGIIPEEDINNTEEHVTKAEFSEILLKLDGFGSASDGYEISGVFRDVQLRDKYAAAIEIAYNRNLISGNGDGTFGKDEFVTVAGISKMLVNVLGYSVYAENRGSYPLGYVSEAKRLGLFSGYLKLDLNKPLTKNEVALICFNALSVDLAKADSYSSNAVEYNIYSGRNILSEYFNIFKIKGIVTDNGISGLYTDSIIDKNTALIESNEKIYEVKNGDSKICDALGMTVECFIESNREDDCDTVIYYDIDSKGDEIIELLPEYLNFSEESINQIAYYIGNSNKKYTINISKNPSVLYNGAVYKEGKSVFELLEDISLKPGKIMFIDFNDDKVYDCINIKVYETMVVERASASSYTITDKNCKYNSDGSLQKVNKLILELDEEEIDLSFTDTNGEETWFDKVKEGSCISYSISSLCGERRKAEIIVSENKIEGEIDNISAKDGKVKIKIDKKEYELSDYYINLLSFGKGINNINLKVGKYMLFTIDAFGRIAFGKLVYEENGMFGVATGVSINESDINKIRIKIYADYEFKVYELSSSVKIDGFIYKSNREQEEAIKNIINKFPLYKEKNMFAAIFKKDKDGRINYIDSPIFNEGKEDDFSLQLPIDYSLPSETSSLYPFKSMSYGNGMVNYMYDVSEASFIQIPESEKHLNDDLYFQNIYQNGLSETGNNLLLFTNEKNSDVITYGVLKSDLDGANWPTDSDYHSMKIFIVSSVYRALDDNGEVTVGVEGMNGDGVRKDMIVDYDYLNGKMWTDVWENNVKRFKDKADAFLETDDGIQRKKDILRPGDIIRYIVDGDGEIAGVKVSYLSDIKIQVSDDQAKDGVYYGYRGFDMSCVKQINGKKAIFKLLIDKTSAASPTGTVMYETKNGYITDYYVDGNDKHSLFDSETNEPFKDEWNKGVAMVNLSQFKILVYDKNAVNDTLRVYEGSIDDLYDMDSAMPPSIVFAHYIRKMPTTLVVYK